MTITLTLGDPAGIGSELILRAYQTYSPRWPVRVVGSWSVLVDTYERLRMLGQVVADPAKLNLVDVPAPGPVLPGQPSTLTGALSVQYLQTALNLGCQAMVTAPIAKAYWQQAGYAYPGQTEFLAQATGASPTAMAFFARSPHTGCILRTLLATTHIPLAQVPSQITSALLTEKLGLLVQSLRRDFGLEYPRIALAGLNPHSGEQGHLGREEEDMLKPWMQAMQTQFPQVNLIGPVPPDTLWVAPAQAWWQENVASPWDACIALYHDQGLIPIKALAFDQAVNTTLGLPFIRTSPDHGTAFDIAGQGKANPASFISAWQWAEWLWERRSGT
ncbi:4-hydroxythreonine-4-phosphate dehydrogenase [Gloeomargarita lithophora Alchichica-D10]|uniref:4-hydroxythreonine-4-phosphate dehydrogenase n=1 Tax=Gloeomargarita lithophora Alchichica-D10 TaxID=1188229 RepID=A0A1J0AFF6_9CYAN|nr:4-hydroxythreonine-4-phosphate dehydrogenase PdxA [Gloeomargarita lithophora]APB34647.1 4-hydroxythreonine-4-phosphate dehydrogenase [Gloeomargarita lithophora Alchichica-D10]